MPLAWPCSTSWQQRSGPAAHAIDAASRIVLGFDVTQRLGILSKVGLQWRGGAIVVLGVEATPTWWLPDASGGCDCETSRQSPHCSCAASPKRHACTSTHLPASCRRLYIHPVPPGSSCSCRTGHPEWPAAAVAASAAPSRRRRHRGAAGSQTPQNSAYAPAGPSRCCWQAGRQRRHRRRWLRVSGEGEE